MQQVQEVRSAFEALVVRPAWPVGGYPPEGLTVPIVGWLSKPAREIDEQQLNALRKAYNGNLKISIEMGRVIIEHMVTICTREGRERECRRLVMKIKDHLGLVATLQ